MKHRIVIVVLVLLSMGLNMNAQNVTGEAKKSESLKKEGQDSIFKAHLVNNEYQVWLDINFYDNNIIVPRQEIFGKVPGYFGAKRDSRKWIISDATIKGKKAILTIINDYGSEDLKAELKRNTDGTYTLTRLEGSMMKIVVDNKWVKIPKELTFNFVYKTSKGTY